MIRIDGNRASIPAAIQCEQIAEEMVRQALGLLEEDMKAAPRYDYNHPDFDYNKKNEYFNRANSFGIPFLEVGLTGTPMRFYRRMLEAISKYKRGSEKTLNRGMVCGNLGVSALAAGDIDGGIAYLLWASQEDRFWSGDPTKSIWANQLYVQFAQATRHGGTSQFDEPAPWLMLKRAIDKYNAEYNDNLTTDTIFNELGTLPEYGTHRALLEGSLWAIHRNTALLKQEKDYEIHSNGSNVYTRLRLFDGLVSLCRFVELRMRLHDDVGGTLGDLLDSIFGKETWFVNDVKQRSKSPQNRVEFETLLKKALEKVGRPGRSILILWTLRNYATHICDPEAPFFFENVEAVLDEIIIAYIHYLKFKKLI